MLLRRLATRREARDDGRAVRYVHERMTSEVLDAGSWKDSWLIERGPDTKKADLETGEDQKGT